MKKILIAGAGHGGLVAGYHLAKAGYAVTVLEQSRREDMGYDWCDTMRRNTFEASGMPFPGDEVFFSGGIMCYNNPSKSVRVSRDKPQSFNIGFIERKFLINYLLDLALEAGVDIQFETAVQGAWTEGNRVVGLVLENGEKIPADLVIDAAGNSSLVRRSLPEGTGILREIPKDELFYVWRGFFNKTSDDMEEPRNRIYFYHCGRCGMDWYIAEENYIDIMVGGFSGLTQADLDEALADFHAEYPGMGDEILRGGCFKRISLRKTLPMLICDGYAMVGESGGMTEPLSGSGIDLSMRGGKILADVIISAKDYTTASLWPYQYTFFKKNGERHFMDEVVKKFLQMSSSDDVDYLFEKKILGAKELASGGKCKYSASDIASKAYYVLRRPAVLKNLSKMLGKIIRIGQVKKSMPEVYDKASVEAWKKQYEQL